MSRIDIFGDRVCIVSSLLIMGWFLYNAIFWSFAAHWRTPARPLNWPIARCLATTGAAGLRRRGIARRPWRARHAFRPHHQPPALIRRPCGM